VVGENLVHLAELASGCSLGCMFLRVPGISPTYSDLVLHKETYDQGTPGNNVIEKTRMQCSTLEYTCLAVQIPSQLGLHFTFTAKVFQVNHCKVKIYSHNFVFSLFQSHVFLTKGLNFLTKRRCGTTSLLNKCS